MQIRPFKPSDTSHIMQLFYDTVHTINAQDYTPEQINAWAPKTATEEDWASKLSPNIAYVVESKQDGVIIGFGDITPRGHLNHLFVHKDYQRKGVARLILHTLIEEAHDLGLYKITAEVSITAKPFFEKFGFEVVTKQKKVVRGMGFVAYKMRKAL